MNLSDLQDKKVINTNDGKMIGNIIDAVITNDGKLDKLIVEDSHFIMSRFSSKNEIYIDWSQIVKIGEDVILVRMEI